MIMMIQIEATQGKFKTDNRRKLDGHSTYDLTYQLQTLDSLSRD